MIYGERENLYRLDKEMNFTEFRVSNQEKNEIKTLLKFYEKNINPITIH